MPADYQQVLDFWFQQIEPIQWFKKDDTFDALIQTRFGDLYWAAAKCELYTWRESAEGRLAEIIVLDQFSRNMFRESPQAFACDPMAVTLVQEAVARGYDRQLPLVQRKFMYMPLMHSESLAIHSMAETLFAQPGLEDNYDYELKHQAIIRRFGRYPHRNQVLGRESSAEEIEFLSQPGSSF